LKSLGKLDGHGVWFRPQLPTTLRLVDRAVAGVRGYIRRASRTERLAVLSESCGAFCCKGTLATPFQHPTRSK
jgi:hypothetical protein